MSFVSLFRRRWQRLAIFSIVFCVVSLSILSSQEDSQHDDEVSELQIKYPLLWKHVRMFNGTGGAWYIPPEWLPESQPVPENIVEAAQLAFQLTNSTAHRTISHSQIPLIVHQTWKNTDIDTWSELICDSVEKWLEFVVDVPMAYFLWTNDGVMQFLEEYDPGFIEKFSSLAANVERADVFRIMVANYIGGIYGDVDTYPLRSPATWIVPSDLMPWYDPETGVSYNSTGPVKAIFGLEADCPPDSDSYWRMGYTHPVQLTQWALASAPGHPVLLRFMDNLSFRLQEVANRHGGNLSSPSAFRELQRLDPLVLTGPDALTVSAQSWLEESAGLRWNALTGLHDGGKSKLVDDVMILPITGFSPGRGLYGNMGSKPITDPDARLLHRAQGSWKSFNLRVEFGKFCRTFFGLCKDWSKV
ncbi:hypothetical protein VTN77DRAFT_5447 [Rasamsonia byssochlamydoides]|uniref:uncharacterized protein n=1 Tax=Rasamsonia byssochlamydoides TaxID=89139 RepID=UPI003742FDE7